MIADMSLLLEPSFTSKKGHFSLKELRILAVELGYDRHLFERRIKVVPSDRLISEKEVCSWLDIKMFDRDLDYVYNRYDADYNVKIIKRAMHHIHCRTLSFKELSKCRQIYEILTVECPQGINIKDINRVLELLKLLDKILPPSKLRHILKVKAHQLDNARLLKLHDIFDIVAMAEDMWKAEHECKQRKEKLSHRYTSRKFSYMQYRMENELELPYQKLLNSMEVFYKSSLLRNKPMGLSTATIPLYKRNTTTPAYIDSKRRERSVTSAQQQGKVLSDYIQRSTSQLLVARTGQPVTPFDYTLCRSRLQSAPLLIKEPTHRCTNKKLLHRSSTSMH